MSRRKGFTAVDLLATLAVTSLLFGQIGGLFLSREKSRRASCKKNISAIGKGLAIYTAAFKDQWPWLISNNQWDAATGAGRFTEPGEKTSYSVTALPFLLIRDGQGPGIFVCPSTSDTPDPNVRDNPRDPNSFHWDFSPYADGNAEHISYSYQAPLVGDKEVTSGATSNSEAGLIVLADRTPAYDGLKPNFNWPKPGKDDPNTGMSQNHTRGEMINLLFADLHVGESLKRADVGINNDSIYSAAGLGDDGKPLDTNQGPGSMKLADHRAERDSFLVGPVKMDKPAKAK